ncbi:MAG: phosphoribosylformylglycinamidine synthase subunit PurL [Alphaproteobacteria bacterium]|jgi:phosphoribosylformylglycinamidine synthase|nr:phosphoribosylformylglycinamidine synthase subunit PurL [Alphaproteobacteria bacterium]MDP6589642.1 phosphoribosylformylglycinamidine synthase subunit PurL [Alphaproteobacteria bacterium]MDP6817525.1 phosphoribosylformylglycinamidine synthase subunit PurL [Alphaproteobacteria bacterium]
MSGGGGRHGDRAAPDAETIAAHGLGEAEYALIEKRMGRPPNITELGIFSVMWSEHCSYKSSSIWLKKLPTEAAWVICGPGENAGVIDIGDGQAAIFKMESHNHPSFIEPYQGAATGVGGIMRDVFTMGARPIANMNALRFGDPAHPRTRHLVSGVVAGIGGYGNCMGIPTIGGECNFHRAYDGNILVNAMTVGLADKTRIFYSAAADIGHPVVYVGSKTGRDGIHGATMASAEFDADTEEKRPTVQVGDPFTEKLVLEACLELMATDAILAIQDMGAAGLTCSSVEMVSKGGTGIELDLDRVPVRETGMTPYEIMLSESQERMLMVLKPGSEDAARKIFEKWGLDFAIVGCITDSGRMVLKSGNNIVGDLPVAPLVDDAPVYERPYERRARPAPSAAGELVPDDSPPPLAALRILLAAPDLCAKRWIWEQYDHMVMTDTILRPGGDAGVVRVHGTNKGLAISTDCTPRYCAAHPESGGAQAVAETWRNLTAVGATPLAITDCLNFGNPERPEVMGQFVGCIEGMAEACRALDFPVISGNVSFYNETEGVGIPPTPAIGGVGMIGDIDRMARIAFAAPGERILLIGETGGHLDASIYAREILGREDGPPPPVDLAAERRNGDFVRRLIEAGRVSACHDISDGGLLVAVAEMALAALAEGREIGAEIDLADDGAALTGRLFGEDQARYIVSAAEGSAQTIIEDAAKANIPISSIGLSGGANLTLSASDAISLNELRHAHEDWLPQYMEAADRPANSGE